MSNKELINISIKILNKSNINNIEQNDLKNGEKINKLNYIEGIKFVFDLILQLEKLFNKGYILKENNLDKNDIILINNNYLIINYENFIKTKVNEKLKSNIYQTVSNLCIKLMQLKTLEDIQPTKLYYMLKRMKYDNEYFFV